SPLSVLSPAPPTTPLSTLSLHDALPIYLHRAAAQDEARAHDDRVADPFGDAAGLVGVRGRVAGRLLQAQFVDHSAEAVAVLGEVDRKSTRLNSSHQIISYAVFRLKNERI